MVWDPVAAIAATVAAVAAIASVLAAAGSWQTASKALKIQDATRAIADGQRAETVRAGRRDALLTAFDRINEPSLSEMRLSLTTEKLPPADELYLVAPDGSYIIRPSHQQVRERLYKSIGRVWMSYEALGLLVLRGLIEPEDAYVLSPSAPIIWDRTLPYIKFERGKGRPRHLEHFERLATGARDYWATRNG